MAILPCTKCQHIRREGPRPQRARMKNAADYARVTKDIASHLRAVAELQGLGAARNQLVLDVAKKLNA